MESIENAISESLDFKIFLGEHAPRLPYKPCTCVAHFQVTPLENTLWMTSQTVESRTPLLVSVYPWDKYSFKKSINAKEIWDEKQLIF